MRACQGGHGLRETTQCRFYRLASFLRGFQSCPLPKNRLFVRQRITGKNMRMAPDHLIFQFSDHLFGVKRAALAGNLAMKNDLMQKIAELFAQFPIIRAVEGFQEFVALFQQ